MNATVKALWIDALTSGEYKQAYGWLRSDNRYCCMGVLCDLYARERQNVNWSDMAQGVYVFISSSTNLPFSVMRWAGLKSKDPKTTKGTLSKLNDNDQLTFDEIAAIIEKDL